MAEEYKTGTGLLRAAVRARKGGTAAIARELAVPNETMHQFAHGNGALPPEKLQALCVYLFGGADAGPVQGPAPHHKRNAGNNNDRLSPAL